MPESIVTEVLPAPPRPESQGTLFDLAEIEGFGALSLRERLFCEAIVLGYSQRAAARAAGVKGDDAAVDVQASRLAHKPEVRRFLGQCWQKSGASIEETLRQAARMQTRAFLSYEEANHRDARNAALKEWQIATAILASIHGRIGVRVEGQVKHAHAHLHGEMENVVTPAMLDVVALIRRGIVKDRIARGEYTADSNAAP